MPAQTVIKIRRDSSTNWESVDPILANGELGFDVTSGLFKVGNGTDAWTAIDYVSDTDAAISSAVATANSYTDSAASSTLSSANSYSDSLAENYDPAGSAAAALADAESYADEAASSAAASAVTTHNSNTTGVHGIADTTLLLTTAGGTLTNYLTLHSAPDQALHAATKGYVDSLAEGLHVHASAVAATTTNIDITNDLQVGDVIDGVTLASTNRVLVKNQTTQAQNGIYVVQPTGAAIRAADFDSPAEVDGGDFIFVTGGNTQADTGWVQTADTVVTIGVDPIAFTQFSGAGTYVAGNGLTLTGNSFAIDTTITATKSDLTAKQNVVSGVSDTEISYLDGVTSAIQTQLNSKAPTANPTFTGLVAGNPAAPANADTAKAIGYVGMPQVVLASGGLTLNATHAGDHIYVTGASQTITIPANASVPFEIGTTIVVINGNVTSQIAITSDTLRLAGGTTTGTRSLAVYGMATLVKISATEWIASGNGLT